MKKIEGVNNLVVYDSDKSKKIFKALRKKGIEFAEYVALNTKRFILLLGTTLVLCSFIGQADMVTTVDGNSYIRTGKGKQYEDIGKFYDGKTGYRVITDDETNWHLVVVGNKIGWVHGGNLKVTSTEPTIFDIKSIEKEENYTTHIHQNVTGKAIYLLSGPDNSYEPVSTTKVEPNECVYVHGITSNGWKLVEYTYEKIFGYVPENDVWESIYDEMPEKDYSIHIENKDYGYPPEYIYVARNDVCLRSDANPKASKIRKYNRGVKLKLISNEKGYWLKVKDDKGNEGFISSAMVCRNPNSLYRDDIICVLIAKTATVLRSTPADLGTLNAKYNIAEYETCEVLEVCDDWLKVRMNKDVGYVKSDTRIFSKLSGICWIVDKGEETLTVYKDNVVLRECKVSTAMAGCITPDGLARVVEKRDVTYFSSVEYKYENYEAKWASRIEYVDKNKKPIKDKAHTGCWFHTGNVNVESHGCTHLSEEDALWLYQNIALYNDLVVYHR